MTRGQLVLITATTLAANSILLAQQAPQPPQPGQPLQHPVSGTGTGAGGAANAAGTNAGAGAIVDTGGLRDSQGVRDAIIQITIAALSDQSALPDRFTDLDKQRLGNQFSQKNQQFDQQFSQFRQAWRDKYHQDFDFGGNKMAVNDASFRIVPNDASSDASSDAARTASSRIDVSSGVPTTNPNVARPSASGAGAASNENKTSSGMAAANPDRSDRPEIGNAVTVIIPSEQNLPTVSVPMTKSGMSDQWKLDIPDTIDANQIQTNLQKHLNAMLDQKQNWPADQNEGYRLVAHHVLAALVNADR